MDELIQKWAQEINEHINIPFLSEAQERMLIEAILRMIISAFEKKTP